MVITKFIIIIIIIIVNGQVYEIGYLRLTECHA